MIDKKELSKALAISVPTINRYMKKGLPFYKVGVKLVRFDLEECRKWIFKKNGK